MTKAWRLAIAVVLVPLSLLAGPVHSEKPEPITGVEQIAGTYYLGDGLGFNFTLTLDPRGTFSYTWQGCLGTYAEASGSAFLRNGELVLEPSSKKGEIDQGFDTRFLPIRWEDRQYLIPSDQIVGFTNQVNGGLEPRSDSFGDVYLRRDDWDKPVTGAPDLPERYQAYLLPEPVNVRVLRKRGTREVEMDAGRGEGLLPGMTLTPVSKEGDLFLCRLEIVSVEEGTAVAKGDEYCKNLLQGDEVSTRLPYAEEP